MGAELAVLGTDGAPDDLSARCTQIGNAVIFFDNPVPKRGPNWAQFHNDALQMDVIDYYLARTADTGTLWIIKTFICCLRF